MINEDAAAELIPRGLLSHVVVDFLAQLGEAVGGLDGGVGELVRTVKGLLEDAFVDAAEAEDMGCTGRDGGGTNEGKTPSPLPPKGESRIHCSLIIFIS